VLSHTLKVWSLELVPISSEESHASKKIPEAVAEVEVTKYPEAEAEATKCLEAEAEVTKCSGAKTEATKCLETGTTRLLGQRHLEIREPQWRKTIDP
ncbi:3215_t:CDS:2, partial [Racocetra persica]